MSYGFFLSAICNTSTDAIKLAIRSHCLAIIFYEELQKCPSSLSLHHHQPSLPVPLQLVHPRAAPHGVPVAGGGDGPRLDEVPPLTWPVAICPNMSSDTMVVLTQLSCREAVWYLPQTAAIQVRAGHV